MTACRDKLPDTLEKIGEVTLERMQPLPNTGRAKMRIKEWDPGADVTKPGDGTWIDFPGTYGVYRRIHYKYDGDKTKCDGPLEYHVCYYTRTADIICHGHLLRKLEPLGEKYEEDELVGLCPKELLKMGVSAGASLLPKALGIARADTGAQSVELASLGTLTADRPAGAGLCAISHKVSRPAFETIVSMLGVALDRQVTTEEPLALNSGWADLSDIADELATRDGPFDRELHDVFSYLAAIDQSGDSISPDEAWINAAGSFISTTAWSTAHSERRQGR